MKLIFRIAAGIVIGYLVLLIINLKLSDYLYQDQIAYSEKNTISVNINVLKSKVTRGIKNYFSKNGVLPSYVSDIYCSNSQHCDVRFFEIVIEDGIYYTKSNDFIVAVTPIRIDNRISYECLFSSVQDEIFDNTPDCRFVANITIPQRKVPSFDCKQSRDYVDQLICTSDKLVDLDLEMTATYQRVVGRGLLSDIEKIKSIQEKFVLQRKRCLNSKCVEKQTQARLTELKLNDKYGI